LFALRLFALRLFAFGLFAFGLFALGLLVTHSAVAVANESPEAKKGASERLPRRDVIVWAREIGDASELTLSKERPILRDAVVRGFVIPRLEGLDLRDLVARFRKVGVAQRKEFHSLDVFGAIADAKEAKKKDRDNAIDDLLGKLETEAKRRREEKEKKEQSASEKLRDELLRDPKESKKDETADGKATTQPRAEKIASPHPVADFVGASLRKRARWILITEGLRGVDGVAPTKTPRSRETIELELKEMIRHILAVPDRVKGRTPDRVLLLLLVPKSGAPTLVARGHSISKGRVSRRPLGAPEIEAGLRALLGMKPSVGPAVSKRWLEELIAELPKGAKK
ncbi:MAG: hypothetical protein AAF517_16075, partial [Planctomycetota bacterium]